MTAAGTIHVVDESGIADSRTAVGVKVARDTTLAEVCGSKDSNSATQGVSGDYEAVSFVLTQSCLDEVVMLLEISSQASEKPVWIWQPEVKPQLFFWKITCRDEVANVV